MRSLWFLLTALALLAATACGADESSDTAATERLVSTATGGQVDFNSLEGTDTLLWFWAPW